MGYRIRGFVAAAAVFGGFVLPAAGPAAARPADDPGPASPTSPAPPASGEAGKVAELVRNGSFESPQSPKAGLVGNFPHVPGWNETTGHGLEIQNGLAPTADGGGSQYVELDSKGPSSIYQDIATVPGRTYRLAFVYAAHPGTAAAESAFEVTFGDSTQSIAPAPQGEAAWRSAGLDIVATEPSTRLTFADGSTSDGTRVRGLGAFVDLVSVTAIG